MSYRIVQNDPEHDVEILGGFEIVLQTLFTNSMECM